jgi:hypothetical protein
MCSGPTCDLRAALPSPLPLPLRSPRLTDSQRTAPLPPRRRAACFGLEPLGALCDVAPARLRDNDYDRCREATDSLKALGQSGRRPVTRRAV